MVYESLAAADILEQNGIKAKVLNIHTVKPIDEKAIIEAAKECGAIVTAEEHQKFGGLGSAVAEVVVKNSPVPMDFVAVNDTFGESGKPSDLITKYGLKDINIVTAVKNVLKRK
jgi:transketolase